MKTTLVICVLVSLVATSYALLCPTCKGSSCKETKIPYEECNFRHPNPLLAQSNLGTRLVEVDSTYSCLNLVYQEEESIGELSQCIVVTTGTDVCASLAAKYSVIKCSLKKPQSPVAVALKAIEAEEDPDQNTTTTESSSTESSTTESSNTESSNTESTTTESSNTESSNTESTTTESSNTESSNTESTTTESSNTESSNTESTTTESSNTESSNTESTTTESSNTESSTTESTTTESSTTESTSSDSSSSDSSSSDSSSSDSTGEPPNSNAYVHNYSLSLLVFLGYLAFSWCS